MKKFLTVFVMFAFLGMFAFAEEQAAAPATTTEKAPAATEKAPAKKAKKEKKAKKAEKTEQKTETKTEATPQ